MATTQKCRYCSEEIQIGAKTCKHCKKDLRLWHYRHPIITILVLGCVGIYAVTSWSISYQEKYLSTSDPKLEVTSMSVEKDDIGYMHIKGEVKNISTYTLGDIMVEGTFLDSNGWPIAVEDFYIETLPLTPDQSSKFDVLAIYDPTVKSGTASFQTTHGTTITTFNDVTGE